MTLLRRLHAPFLVLLLTGTITAQELTLQNITTAPQALLPRMPQTSWVPGDAAVCSMLLRASDPRGKDRVELVDPTRGKMPAFDADRLHAAFAKAGLGLRRNRIPPFTWIDNKTLRFNLGGPIYHWDMTTDAAKLIWRLPQGSSRPAFASKDQKVAFVRGHQLHVQGQTMAPRQLTTDGSEDVVYGGAAHRAEFGIHDGIWWGPKSRYVAFSREDLAPITAYPYANHTKFPSKGVHGRYPFAGEQHSLVRVGVYDVKSGKLHYLQQPDGDKDVYWTNVTFGPKGQKIYVAIVNRGQDHMQLVRFDSASGKREKVLFEERDKEWIEPEHGPIFLPASEDGENAIDGAFLWFSPRDGYRHLYLYDLEGKLVRQVTKGKFDVRSFVRFTDDRRTWVMASGDNPLHMHLWAVNLREGSMQQVTTLPGQHVCQVTDDGTVLDRMSNVAVPGRLSVLETSGKEIKVLATATNPIGRMGHQRFFKLQAADKTTLHGHLILPPELNEDAKQHDKKYPVLLYVYGGPHSQLVKDQWFGGASLWLHFMATQGFIVCRLDNRGTDNRGIEFSQKVHRKLSLLEVQDQLTAVKYLQSLPYVDAKRIGVHGWSYGGYMTLSLMTRAPGVFACGAAGAPVTDWKGYETGYTERYMDTPQQNPNGYKNTSVLPLARNLKGRLLILHGTDDKTVMWTHSLAFVDKCIDHGVLVDYMPYPMQKHGFRGKDRVHLYKLMTRFFTEHLEKK